MFSYKIDVQILNFSPLPRQSIKFCQISISIRFDDGEGERERKKEKEREMGIGRERNAPMLKVGPCVAATF